MSEPKGRLEKTFAYLDWNIIIRSVLMVYHDNRENYNNDLCPYKPSADIWCINDELRQDLLDRVRVYWCQYSGLDRTRFPYSVDAVSIFYFRIRKRSKEEVEMFIKELGPVTRVVDESDL